VHGSRGTERGPAAGIAGVAFLVTLLLLATGIGSTGVIHARSAAAGPASASAGPTYRVNFTASGIRPGTNWSVDLDGSLESSRTSSILFAVPNGSYPYQASTLVGGVPEWVNGTVPVHGSPVSMVVTFPSTPNGSAGNPPTAAPSSAGPGSVLPLGLFLLALAAVGALLATAVLVARRQGRRGRPPSGSTPSSTPPTQSTTEPAAEDPLRHML
jgi:hypothetical protein